jgi:hypothetical protein
MKAISPRLLLLVSCSSETGHFMMPMSTECLDGACSLRSARERILRSVSTHFVFFRKKSCLIKNIKKSSFICPSVWKKNPRKKIKNQASKEVIARRGPSQRFDGRSERSVRRHCPRDYRSAARAITQSCQC